MTCVESKTECSRLAVWRLEDGESVFCIKHVITRCPTEVSILRKGSRFPGEGWSQIYFNFKMDSWNTLSMTFDGFQCCKSLHCDVFAVNELWRTQDKFQTRSKEFIVGEAKVVDVDGENTKRFPKDRAAGVGILLSPAAEQKVLTFGSVGERVCLLRATARPSV